MNMLNRLYHLWIEQSTARFIEESNIQLLNDWIRQSTTDYLHPQCSWKLTHGHPQEGCYRGRNFYEWYTNQLASTYTEWTEVIDNIVGSQIGGIIVGEYKFQDKKNKLVCAAPFAHFYKIENGQITSIRFSMGNVKTLPDLTKPEFTIDSGLYSLSLN